MIRRFSWKPPCAILSSLQNFWWCPTNLEENFPSGVRLGEHRVRKVSETEYQVTHEHGLETHVFHTLFLCLVSHFAIAQFCDKIKPGFLTVEPGRNYEEENGKCQWLTWLTSDMLLLWRNLKKFKKKKNDVATRCFESRKSSRCSLRLSWNENT